MHSRIIDRKGRIQLGRELHSLRNVVGIYNAQNGMETGKDTLMLMKVTAHTSCGDSPALAVMTGSYNGHLVLGYEGILLRRSGGRYDEKTRRALRSFNISFEASDLRSAKRVHIPQRVREHTSIHLYGRVFVAGRNGYVVISPNPEAIAEIEAAPLDTRATTIDELVSVIVKETQIEREAAAASC